jgi:NOL1/NOP2/fmu family ribosome biogenesis protein
MQNLKILNSKEIKIIHKNLKEQFGFEEKLNYVFLRNSNDRIYIVNRAIDRFDLEALRIDSIGLYFATVMPEGLRLSIEGSQLIGPKAQKNILEIKDLAFEMWLKGLDFKVETNFKDFVIVKHNNNFVGCGKIKDGSLFNYVPKARRLIVVNN